MSYPGGFFRQSLTAPTLAMLPEERQYKAKGKRLEGIRRSPPKTLGSMPAVMTKESMSEEMLSRRYQPTP